MFDLREKYSVPLNQEKTIMKTKGRPISQGVHYNARVDSHFRFN